MRADEARLSGVREWCVVAFSNTRAALQGQQTLEQAGVKAFMMPTPREITAGCGLSLRLPPEAWVDARQALNLSDIPADGWRSYRMENNEQVRVVTPIE